MEEERNFTTEQVTAMLLSKLKETAESVLKKPVVDCVISVSSIPTHYWGLARRSICILTANDIHIFALGYMIILRIYQTSLHFLEFSFLPSSFCVLPLLFGLLMYVCMCVCTYVCPVLFIESFIRKDFHLSQKGQAELGHTNWGAGRGCSLAEDMQPSQSFTSDTPNSCWAGHPAGPCPSISSAPKPELERETQMAPGEGVTLGAPGSGPEYQPDFEVLGRKGTESGRVEVSTEYR